MEPLANDLSKPGCHKLHKFRDQVFSRYAIKLPSCTSFLIWTLGFSLAITFTIRDFAPLLSEYRDNNVAIQVEVKLLEENFEPPHIILNIPTEKFRDLENDDLRILARYLNETGFPNSTVTYTEGWRLYQQLINVSWDVWNELNFMQQSFNDSVSLHNTLSLALLHKLFLNDEITDILNEGNSSWNGPIISSIISYIQWQNRADYILGNPVPKNYRLRPGPDFLNDITDRDRKLEILFDEILKVLCRKTQFIESDFFYEVLDATPTNATCQTWLLETNDPVPVGYTGIWIPLPNNENATRKEYRFIFTHNNSSLTTGPIVLYVGTGILYATSMDGTLYPYLYQTPVDNRQILQRVTARYKVQMRARDTRSDNSCRNISDVISCFSQCTRQWTIQKCQCIPLRVRKRFGKKFPYCTYTSYKKCNITELPKHIKQGCKDSCANACSYTSYTWQFGYDTAECDRGTSEFVLDMIPTVDTFAEFTWTTKNSPEQFFSQLCGVGSFYLGFSGLSVFAALIMLIDWWKQFRKKKKDLGLNGEQGSSHRSVDLSRKSSDFWQHMTTRGIRDEEWLGKLREVVRVEVVREGEKLRAELKEWKADIEMCLRRITG